MSKSYTEIINNFTFEMHLIEGGTFLMGSEDDDSDAFGDEKPRHEVVVKSFFIGKYPVTQALWRAVAQAAPEFGLDENPSEFEGDDRPVEQVSWEDAQIFIKMLNELTKSTRPAQHLYRLPTEAEWEYAARGGKYWADDYQYAGSDRLKDLGWFDENSGGMTRPVGLKQPNQLGLHDISGNVWEWCEDDWHGDYKNNPPLDGTAWIDSPRGSRRVARGGSWAVGALRCRAAYRLNGSPDDRWSLIGFRLALSPQ
jgi:formylglycine-generating enzyme required for sulfatase activity